jgi:tetratricopeptide (TPR) repeat protein
MVRDVAYASLPKRERRRLHEAIAARLSDPDDVAWAADHLERAAIAARDLDPADREPADRAIEALTAAADRARRRSETRSALDLGRRALALAAPQDGWGPREAWILAGVGEAHYWLGDFAIAIETLDRAAALGDGDDRVIAHALRFRGDLAINVEDDLEAAEGMFARSLEAAERSGDGHAVARTLLFAGWVPWHRERFDEAAGVWTRALAAAEAAEDHWAEVRILTAMSVNAADMSDVVEGTRLIEKAQALAQEMGDRLNVAVTSIQRGRRAEEAGRYDEAVPLLDRGIEIFRELGARWDLADSLAERGIVYRELGRLDEAERDLEEAVAIAAELGDRQLPTWMYRALSRVAELRGDAERAAHLMEHSRETSRSGDV